MLFHYVAVEASGNLLEADFEADTLNDVLHYLSGKELRPLSVKEIKRIDLGGFQFFKHITMEDKVFLTKYLALMLRVGTNLLSAINILIADFENPAVKNFLLEARENLTKGQPFYEVFAKHPETWSLTFINLVKAAEKSGRLVATFEQLSTTLEAEAALRSRIRAAMIYPIILFFVACGIILFLVAFAIPKLASVFLTGGIQPPVFSRVVFGIGLFIGSHLLPLFSVAIIGGGTVFWTVNKTRTGKRIFEQLIGNLPLIKNIQRDLAVQRMASTMSSLMKAGLPIIETITISADVVGSHDYKAALLRVANEGLEKGLTMGEAFRRETVFPSAFINLIAISEKAGHLEEVLATLADFYGTNVDASIKALVSLVEPLMLLGMGVVVATIALSIIIPIYQLTSQF
jgi:type IV pilus assembly protein PilC